MALGRLAMDAWDGIRVERCWAEVDGRQMHCLKAGAGPELILLHGLLGTASTWELAMPWLAGQSTVYAVDALGIGESERVPGLDATLEAQAGRVVRLMDRFGIENADFLATSHGGAVALTIAANYPDRVKNLVLHAPANPFSHICDSMVNFYLSGLGNWFAHQVPGLPGSMQSLALGRMYGDPVHLRVGSLGKYIGSLQVPGTVDYVLDILKAWFDDMAKLRLALDCVRRFPVLLLWGDRDRAVALNSARELERCFDQVDFELLPGAGHLPFEECPEAFTRLVNTFLSKVRGAGPRLVSTASHSI
jgi:4,5:9,10-diseco-3-hydroxy-5,9,17-trioxoandrosta-1(10),2-diene-4-oate hydrolase